MSRDNGLELKVGAFVLLAVLALTFFVLSISDLSFFEKGRHIQVVFVLPAVYVRPLLCVWQAWKWGW